MDVSPFMLLWGETFGKLGLKIPCTEPAARHAFQWFSTFLVQKQMTPLCICKFFCLASNFCFGVSLMKALTFFCSFHSYFPSIYNHQYMHPLSFWYVAERTHEHIHASSLFLICGCAHSWIYIYIKLIVFQSPPSCNRFFSMVS